jgi:hypothetical protein
LKRRETILAGHPSSLYFSGKAYFLMQRTGNCQAASAQLAPVFDAELLLISTFHGAVLLPLLDVQ